MCMYVYTCIHKPILEIELTPMLPVPIHPYSALSYLSPVHYYDSVLFSIVKTLAFNNIKILIYWLSFILSPKQLQNCFTTNFTKPQNY